MTVPALDTSFIGTFAYIQPATSIQLADALPYFHAYQQYPEYVDGVMRIWDTGSESPAPNNYSDVYVRIRTDGWMMAFIPDDAHQGLACWSPYDWILSKYYCRGDLLWWGHHSETGGNPTTNATRLGRALSELWDVLKTNSDNPTYEFDYADVGYYDYEHTTSTKIYVFGKRCWHTTVYYYFTAPIGTNVQAVFFDFGSGYSVPAYLNLNGVVIDRFGGGTLYKSGRTEGFWVSSDYTLRINVGGVQNTVALYNDSSIGYYAYGGTVIFADG